MLRFLLKFLNLLVLICDNNAKTTSLFHWNRNRCKCYICLVCLVEIKHHLIIHFVNMVAAQNQHIVRVIIFHISQILIYSIRCTCIPLTAGTLLIWRQNRNSTYITIQIPRNTNANVCIQAQRLILCQHADGIYSRINAIAQWKIDNTVLPTKRYRWFSNISSQNPQPGSLSTCQ